MAPVDGLHLKVADVPDRRAPLAGETRLGAAGLVVIVVVVPPDVLVEDAAVPLLLLTNFQPPLATTWAWVLQP